MKNLLLTSLFAICIYFSPLGASGQDVRRLGLTASMQGPQLGIMMPVWLGNSFTLAPAIDFKYAQDIGSDLAVALVPKYYFRTEGVAPFISARAGAAFSFPAEGNHLSEQENTTDLLGGLGFGAEYFFTPRFSAGVEAQANFTKSDENSSRFGNAGALNFNTATAASISIYF